MLIGIKPKPTANGVDGYSDETSPVGSYPNGKLPYEAFDMIGNVWEWIEAILGIVIDADNILHDTLFVVVDQIPKEERLFKETDISKACVYTWLA